MDPLVLLFLILIVVVSGVIGVLADNVGRKLGKKRLTLWKLRPRHTAGLGTALTGMVTSAVTILLVFVLSSDVRDWIIKGRAAILAAQQLDQKNKKLESSAKTMQVELVDLGDQKTKLNAKLLADTQSLGAVEKKLEGAENRYAAAAEREKAVRARLAVSFAKLKTTADRLVAASRQMGRVQSELNKLSITYGTLYNQNKDQLDEDKKLRDQKANLTALNQGLSANLQALQKTSDELSKQLIADQKAQAQAKADLASAQSDLSSAKDELSQIKEQVKAEEQALMGYRQVAEATRTQPMMFSQGEELTRVQLPAHADRRAVENGLTKLLREARIVATKRGAGVLHSNGDSAGLVNLTVNGATVTPAEQEDAIIDRLVGEPHEVVLVAQSLLNSFRGEYVAVDVHGYNNPVVFKRRQVVATTRINGRLSRERLLSQLADFIKNGVIKNALSAGMIPVEGSSAGLLDVPPLTTLTVVEQLASSGRQMRVQAIATEDTHAADQLELEFVLK